MSVARFIADQRTFYRVPYAVCCVILGVSVSWLYKWIKNEPRPQQRRRGLLPRRRRKFLRHRPDLGRQRRPGYVSRTPNPQRLQTWQDKSSPVLRISA